MRFYFGITFYILPTRQIEHVKYGPVTLRPFALRSAEQEENEDKCIKSGMDVVHTEYNRIRMGKDGMVV